MKVFCTRSLVSTALSCWFGFLACLLGCAQPALATAPCRQAQAAGENLASANANTDDSSSCCEHGRNSSREPNKNKHSRESCCPLYATLIQTQNAVSRLSSGTDIAVLVSFTRHPLSLGSASGAIWPPKIWHAGRDILLQAHVHRI